MHGQPVTNLRCLSVKILILAIAVVCICGVLVVGQARTPDSGDILFPGQDSLGTENHRKTVMHSADDGDTQIPLDIANRLDSIETVDQFLQFLQGVPSAMTPLFINSKFDGEERSNAIKPAPAKCIPELQAIPLKVDDDPSIMIFPPCTRINRCGGCCSSSLLSCQPTATEIRNFEVIVASVKEWGYKGRRIIPLEEHTKCKCDCRIKEEDCTDKQHYEPHNCQCACSNTDEEQKCRKNSDIKAWNKELCSCACRSVEQCSTGFYFNQVTCRCGPINSPVNRFVPTKGSDYNFGNRQPQNVPPVIISLDQSNTRRKQKEDPESRSPLLSCPWCTRNN